MMYFNPVKIIFGESERQNILKGLSDKNVLIVATSTSIERYKRDSKLADIFNQKNLTVESAFGTNPSLDDMNAISKKYIKKTFDHIVGIGGGSAMDVAKIASISIPAFKNGIKIKDLLTDSSFFKGLKEIDCTLVPTTAGTGSEVTPFATIWDYQNKQKKSLGHDSMFAKKAYVDPDFLKEIPADIALSTGLDSLNQAFESIWNKNANNLTRQLSIEAATLALKSLPNLKNLSFDGSLRENLCNASLFAGLAISQTRTSICHSISYPLTLKYGIDHGIACAFSMLEVYKYNSQFIKDDIESIKKNINIDPHALLEEIFKQYKINQILKKYLPQKQKFTESIDDFISEGRFENNIKDCKTSDLLKIINNSYDSVNEK